ncbi:glycoside hydrolase family 88 protein [Bacteroides salyersiae]|uniref:glycoside hydrolase family 88 protein n=1 Tax=Bacteroides salyersiae TaxID=291644 RepID=UPI0022205BD5|nr:glycoside hydrolase family 88 protein [Bacteroides salyersiae]UYU39400.1 glycoside hydrolase family 88 protein [Bacteroides salyersiae]
MKKQFWYFIFLLFYIGTLPVQGKITLPAILSDNMVLQQKSQVRFWGKARPGEKVTVSTSWDKNIYTVQTPTDGYWEVKIKTPGVMDNQTLTVKGENTITIHNILIGEVWLCTGQSNMEFPVARDPNVKWKTGILNETEEMKDADYPSIRLFHVEHQLAPEGEKEDCIGRWLVCTPENVKEFSAVGFIFGRKLYKELQMPVGLIQSTWGGTHAESWTERRVMKDNPLYADVMEEFAPQNVKREKDKCKVPATLWNGMIAPIKGYTIKGNIWYQGESNSIRHEKYQKVFTNLINSWRQEWGQADMPFYFVQIAPHYKQPAGIREAQLKTWQSGLKNIGMVVITDAGDSTDIHPRNKRVTGERLAAWALAKQYGKKTAYSGPLYKSMKVKDGKVTLTFDYAEGGLQTPENAPVRGFFISGADARFYPATAAIQGSKLELSAPEVPQPVAVRYGYGNFFRVNLYNKAGLPAVPFRTDHFAPDTYARWFADSEMRRFPKAYQLDHGRRLFFGYAQGVGCCAMLRMWRQTGERHYFDYVEAWVDSLINEKGEIHLYDMSTYNLDFINSGKVLFDVYRETGNDKYKKAMDELIKQLKRHPRTLEGGYWHKLIYQHQMWLDGLYMASPFMAQYGAEFNRPEWIDEAVKQFALCHKHTYDAGTGLYHHAWDESKSQRWANPETGHSPNFWGRSIGWWFMALVDALDYIPEEHPGRSDMISWIQGLADTLPKYQDKAGLWYQVIDQPKREGNFPEASVTSQCMYAYAKAVNKGYIDAKYKAVAEKAFKGLKDKLLVENADGTLTLTRCCQVGGLGGHPYRDGSFEYYIGEKMRDNDAKATGPFIMGCIELNK